MRLVVTGGGTGGHLFPGLALAKAMQQAVPQTEVLFIGTSRALDQQVLTGTNMETVVLNCSGLKGTSVFEKARSLLQQPAAVLAAIKILRRFRADLVFAVGGYVTGPVMVAAKMLGVPVCIHEQNSVPGLANRLAGRIVDTICTSIPCGDTFPAAKVVQTGNPIRQEILETAVVSKVWKNPLTLLVLGGSQGAHRINVVFLEAIRELVGKELRFRVIHQTGQQDYEMVASAYDDVDVVAEVQPFFKDMAKLYSRAHFVVSRAGATTLAELAVAGLPAVLIPYPYAADNHQQTNAEFYAKGGGCLIRQQDTLSGDELATLLRSLLLKPEEKLCTMAANMREMGVPEATDRIVEQCLRLMEKKSGTSKTSIKGNVQKN